MIDRLPWQRNPEGGFVAYPDGASKTRYATIERDGTQHGARSWRWQVVFDDSRQFLGWEGSQQACADAALEAWPRAMAAAAQLAVAAAAEASLRTIVQRMTAKGDLPLSVFEIETAPTERLTHILWLIKDAGGIAGPAAPLVEACSAELFRRRTSGSAGTAGASTEPAARQ